MKIRVGEQYTWCHSGGQFKTNPELGSIWRKVYYNIKAVNLKQDKINKKLKLHVSKKMLLSSSWTNYYLKVKLFKRQCQAHCVVLKDPSEAGPVH